LLFLFLLLLLLLLLLFKLLLVKLIKLFQLLFKSLLLLFKLLFKLKNCCCCCSSSCYFSSIYVAAEVGCRYCCVSCRKYFIANEIQEIFVAMDHKVVLSVLQIPFVPTIA
jgi:hypothetical protein